MKIAQNPFGSIYAPPGVANFGGGQAAGIADLLSVVIKTLIIVAAIYAVFNLVLAGYWYITAAGEPKRISDATAKIWHTVIGLIVAAGSVAIAALVGQIFFGSANAVLQVQLFTPN